MTQKETCATRKCQAKKIYSPRLGIVHLALEENAFDVGIFGQCLRSTCTRGATTEDGNLVFGTGCRIGSKNYDKKIYKIIVKTRSNFIKRNISRGSTDISVMDVPAKAEAPAAESNTRVATDCMVTKLCRKLRKGNRIFANQVQPQPPKKLEKNSVWAGLLPDLKKTKSKKSPHKSGPLVEVKSTRSRTKLFYGVKMRTMDGQRIERPPRVTVPLFLKLTPVHPSIGVLGIGHWVLVFLGLRTFSMTGLDIEILVYGCMQSGDTGLFFSRFLKNN